MDQLKSNSNLAAYLIRSGACTRELADELSRRAEKSWVPLGLMLVREGKLRMRDVGKILTVQADRPKQLFGHLAVELGLCTEDDVEEVMATQKRASPHIFDLAVEDKRVDNEKLLVAVKAYVRHAEEIIARLDDAVVMPAGT